MRLTRQQQPMTGALTRGTAGMLQGFVHQGQSELLTLHLRGLVSANTAITGVVDREHALIYAFAQTIAAGSTENDQIEATRVHLK